MNTDTLKSIATFAAAAGYLWLIKPNKKRDISRFMTFEYNHRGIYDNLGGIPENSLPAFLRAAKLGYAVELDVRLTADNKVVVFHDDTLLRMCGIDKRVRDFTYAELRSFRLLNTEYRIPLFSHVLKILDGVTVLCEIKECSKTERNILCRKVAAAIDRYNGNICIESFDPFILAWFKKSRPDIIRGQLSMNFLRTPSERGSAVDLILTSLILNSISRPDFLAYNRFDIETLPFMLCKKVYKTPSFGWTFKNSVISESEKTAFDCFISER